MLNACPGFDSVVGLSNGKSHNCGTLPSQEPVWTMEHESKAEINSLLLMEILGS